MSSPGADILVPIKVTFACQEAVRFFFKAFCRKIMLDGVMEAISSETGVMSLSCTPKVCGVQRLALYL